MPIPRFINDAPPSDFLYSLTPPSLVDTKLDAQSANYKCMVLCSVYSGRGV